MYLFIGFSGYFDYNIIHGVGGGRMHVVFVFFVDTVEAKVRQTSTMTSIIVASRRGDRKTI